VQRDLDRLAPTFRAELEGTLRDVREAGFSPLLWETIRSPERARWLKERGRSKAGERSMHVLGIAADVICEEHHWGCPRGCGFYDALQTAAERRGLTSGRSWGWDSPHVQAIPVAMQDRARECTTTAELEELIREHREGACEP